MRCSFGGDIDSLRSWNMTFADYYHCLSYAQAGHVASRRITFCSIQAKIKPSTNFSRQIQFGRRLNFEYGRMKIGLSRTQHIQHFLNIGIFISETEASPEMSHLHPRAFYNELLLCIAQLLVTTSILSPTEL